MKQMKTGASFSPKRVYRYVLWRMWNDYKPKVAIIGLNPSTADETQDDPTIKRCIEFAKSWDMGGLFMLNLFAYRATKPAVMKKALSPIGKDNDSNILRYVNKSRLIVAAWGTHGSYLGRDKAVMQLLQSTTSVHCLGLTAEGHPKHPLFLKADTQLIEYQPAQLVINV